MSNIYMSNNIRFVALYMSNSVVAEDALYMSNNIVAEDDYRVPP